MFQAKSSVNNNSISTKQIPYFDSQFDSLLLPLHSANQSTGMLSWTSRWKSSHGQGSVQPAHELPVGLWMPSRFLKYPVNSRTAMVRIKLLTVEFMRKVNEKLIRPSYCFYKDTMSHPYILVIVTEVELNSNERYPIWEPTLTILTTWCSRTLEQHMKKKRNAIRVIISYEKRF
jgi:hypothetical protein